MGVVVAVGIIAAVWVSREGACEGAEHVVGVGSEDGGGINLRCGGYVFGSVGRVEAGIDRKACGASPATESLDHGVGAAGRAQAASEADAKQVK